MGLVGLVHKLMSFQGKNEIESINLTDIGIDVLLVMYTLIISCWTLSLLSFNIVYTLMLTKIAAHGWIAVLENI